MIGQFLVGYLSFASPWMLFAIASVAIPLLMHLIRRRFPRTMSWAAMEILQDVLREQRQRVRTGQWLLLLLRILALLLLSLAVARPFWKSTSAAASSDNRAAPLLHIIAIDHSLSMTARENNQTVFEQAKSQAIDLIQQSASGDYFTVLTFGQTATTIIGSPSSSNELVSAAITKLEPTDTTSNLESAARAVMSIANAVREQGFTAERIRTHVFTDMGNDSFLFATNESKLKEIANLLKTTNTTIRKIGSENTDNLAVTNVTHQADDYLVGLPIELLATVRNFGRQSRTTTVQVSENGQLVDSKLIELEAEEESNVRFEFTPKESRVYKLTIQISEDQLVRDNQRYVPIRVQSQRRMLFVQRSPSVASFSERAITAGREDLKGVSVSRIAPHELPLENLSKYQFVVLEDIDWTETNLVKSLSEYASTGGNIICLLGYKSMFSPTVYSQSSAASRLLGLSVTGRTASRNLSVSPLDYRSPVVRPFENFPQSGLLTLPIFQVWQATVDEANATVDLSIVNNAETEATLPLLVRNRIGLGQIATWLSAPEDGRVEQSTQAWNAIAAWPAFVPLWQNLVSVMAGHNAETITTQTGTPLRGSIADHASNRLSIATPSGEESSSIILSEQNGVPEWLFNDTDTQGFFELRQNDRVLQTFAANVDTAESSLQSYSATGTPLAELTRDRTFDQSSVQWARSDIQSTTDHRNNRFSNGLLIALLVCLFSESLVACLLGRRLA